MIFICLKFNKHVNKYLYVKHLNTLFLLDHLATLENYNLYSSNMYNILLV
jgi:hypothetical protein